MPQPAVAIRKYVIFMALFAVGHAAAGVMVFFYPAELVYLLNFFPKVFKTYEVLPETIGSEARLWLVPAATLEFLTAVICGAAAIRPAIALLPWLVVMTKLVAGAGFIYLFLRQTQYFAYFSMAIMEAVLALAVTWITVRASIERRSRARAADRATTYPVTAGTSPAAVRPDSTPTSPTGSVTGSAAATPDTESSTLPSNSRDSFEGHPPVS